MELLKVIWFKLIKKKNNNWIFKLKVFFYIYNSLLMFINITITILNIIIIKYNYILNINNFIDGILFLI